MQSDSTKRFSLSLNGFLQLSYMKRSRSASAWRDANICFVLQRRDRRETSFSCGKRGNAKRLSFSSLTFCRYVVIHCRKAETNITQRREIATFVNTGAYCTSHDKSRLSSNDLALIKFPLPPGKFSCHLCAQTKSYSTVPLSSSPNCYRISLLRLTQPQEASRVLLPSTSNLFEIIARK